MSEPHRSVHPLETRRVIRLASMQWVLPFLLLVASLSSGCGSGRVPRMPMPRALGNELTVYQVPSSAPADHASANPAIMPRLSDNKYDSKNENAVFVPEDRIADGSSSTALTLSRSVALALAHHPSLAAFAWQVRAREGTQLQASLIPNPSILFELENFAGSGPVRAFDQTEATVWFSQSFQLGGKRRKRSDLASLQVELAGWDFETARLDVLTQTRQRYLDVLAACERLTLADATRQLAREVEASVAKQLESGESSTADLGKAEVARVSAHIDHQQALAAIELARARLAEMWGGEGPSSFEIDGDLPSVSPLPSLEILAQHLDNAPEVARWATELPAREAALRVAEAAAIPDLQLSAGYRHFEATGDGALVFSSSLPLPVINRNQGGVESARSAVAGAQAQRRRAVTAQRAALSAAYSRTVASAETARSLREESLPAAHRAFAAISEGYASGRFTYLDVLDAQRTLFNVQALLVDALANHARNRFTVERLIATPLAGLGGES